VKGLQVVFAGRIKGQNRVGWIVGPDGKSQIPTAPGEVDIGESEK